MSSSNNLFSDSTSIDSGVDDLQNPKFDYTGAFDKQGFRDGYGCQTWDKPFLHKYSGYFLYNNMHDKGFYFIGQEDGVSFYDGQFYNNKLEGYGQVIYKDGKVHEGLFKDNRKFGPGVLTYGDETQDVGLWNGNYLIRLSISMSSDIVPSLCYNPANKVKLLRFKKIVPAMPERRDLAKDVMQGLTKDDSLSQRYPELYNPHVRNENSLFFDCRLYDLAQLGSEDTLIETGRRSNELSRIYLQEKSRKVLDVVNKFKAVFYLYCFIREEISNQYTLHLAKFLANSDEALKYIRYIFNSGKMPRSYFSLLLIAELMMYVDNVNNIKKTVEIKLEEMSLVSYVSHKSKIETDVVSTTSKKIKPDEMSLASFKSHHSGKPTRRDYNLNDYLQQLDESSFDECSEASSEYVDRWVTDESLRKCNVCYFCMQRKDKTLLRCPQCGVVKFCSRRCNYLSLKLKNFHPCPGVFYQDVYKDVKVFIDNNLPLPVYGIDLAFETLRNKRLNKAKKISEDSSVKSHRSLRIRLRGGDNTTQENQYVSCKTTQALSSRIDNKICVNKTNKSDEKNMTKDGKKKNFKTSLTDEIIKHLSVDRMSRFSYNSSENIKDSEVLKLTEASERNVLVKKDRTSNS